MEVVLDCFFNQVFSEFERGILSVRYKRRAMVDHISTMMEGCIKGADSNPQDVCRYVVKTAIRFHEKHKEENGNICIMGKYHNILYIAAKLCFDWQLKDSATVACLLDKIFACEKTFERLFLGAIFGCRAPYFMAGWKSDFSDQEENVRAIVYFIDHACTAGLEYNFESKGIRFIDTPIESCGNMSPVRVTIHTGAPDLLLIMLRFGAVMSEDAHTSGLKQLLEKLREFKGVYPFNLVACLKIILRTIISVRVYPEDENYVLGSNVERECFLTEFPSFIEDGLVPESRCGMAPPELKHLCRCAVRYRLWENHQLPNGTRKLPVPESLRRYLDLFLD